MSANKAKGTSYESQIRLFLNDNGFPNARRQVLHGSNDTGDIEGIQSIHGSIILQCKNHKSMQLAEWLKQTKHQGELASALPILVHKRKGSGIKSTGQQYVTMELDDLLTLLKQAGYE